MTLLSELLQPQVFDYVPLVEAIESVIPIRENTRGRKISPKGASKDFFKANPSLVVGAAALAVGAYTAYKKNKRNTITLHAKDAYERRMMTSIIDALTKDNKFRIIRTKFQSGGKSWVLKRVGTQL